MSKDCIRHALENYRTIAVVGLSNRPSRPSHGVSAYMQQHGYRIIPVNPEIKESLGEKAFPSLPDVSEPVEIVNIFRRSEFVPEIVEQAIQIKAKVIWMQEGVSHGEAAERARRAGIDVVQNRCILKEYAKRFVADGI